MMPAFWLFARNCYYVVSIVTFGTFPSIVIPGSMPGSIIALCYLIAGLCGLLMILDNVRGLK